MSNVYQTCATYPGYQESSSFEILLCETCNTSFPYPHIDASHIYNLIYKHGSKVPGYNRYWKYYDQVSSEEDPFGYLADSEEAYWAVRESLSQLVIDKANTKILEVGSGLGYLTFAMRSAGYNVVGMDISEKAVEQANIKFNNYFITQDIYKPGQIEEKSMDLIILTEVIEHIDNPISFLHAVAKLLKDGGHIVVTTPNKSIAPKNIIWDTEAPPIHLWWFSETSFEHIAEKISMKIRFIDFSKFYKQKPFIYNLTKAGQNLLREPILDKNGGLKRIAELKDKKTDNRIYAWIKRIDKKIKSKINPDIVSLDRQGRNLCAILKKEEN